MRKILALSLLLVCFQANGRMFPKGKEPKFHINSFSATGLTQTQFDDILKRMEQALTPLYTAKGKTLHVAHLWSNETINSDAQWQGNTCWINAYGGLARAMTMGGASIEDAVIGYASVNAHENGHCLGGPPLYPGDVMSDEGQADTYSVDGLRKAGFTGAEIDRASRTITGVLAALNGEPKPSWPGPKLPVVTVTFHSHSDAQCRMDSMLFHLLGAPRPNCWYAGGAPTGVIPASPTPVPVPDPKPMPCGCNCCACQAWHKQSK